MLLDFFTGSCGVYTVNFIDKCALDKVLSILLCAAPRLAMARLPVYLFLLIMSIHEGVPGAEAFVDMDDLETLLRLGQEECSLMHENVTFPGIDPDFHCGAQFDGITCWPPTAPGVIAELTCPAMFDRYQTTSVHKTCFPNATWKVDDVLAIYGGQGECRCVQCEVVGILLNLGYGLSLAACAVAFIIFMTSRTLRCTRNLIHLHLICSFMLKYMVYFIQPPVVVLESLHPKRVVVFLLYYFEQTNYFWMFVEGLYLHTLVVFALRIDADKISFLVYCVIGWAMPLVFVGVWAIVSVALYPEGDLIDYTVETTVVHEYVCVIGPILLVLVINCFFLLNIVRLLMSKLRMQSNRTSDIKQYRRAARATLFLVVLLGVGYVLMLCRPFLEENLPNIVKLIFEYVSTLLAGTQGLAVAVIYVFLNTEVRTVLKRKWRRRFGHKSPSCLNRKRAKPRTSSYSKYDDQTCMSTMRSVAHNDTVMDCYHDDDQGHRGHHQGNKAGNRGATTQGKNTGTVANGDAKKTDGEEKLEMQVVKNNGTVGKWDRTEKGNEADEVEPLLEEGGNPPKPAATIVISEATPVHTTAKEPNAEYEENQE
ncbi:corticotropin-releasing factor receptor 1-like [Patiria miniata]|uniref:Uncharacterized protein n=1 Tax=Patiria miniata TaxID=46514 RepID=A0A913YYC1_PATMI|nr:corticotropin-releasing factor receptor 1-like [Patiria miniata]